MRLFPSFGSMNHFCWVNRSYISQHYLCRRLSFRLRCCRPLHDSRQLPSLFTAAAASRQARPDRDPTEALARKRLQIFSDNCPKRPRPKYFSLFVGIINKSGLATVLSSPYREASMVTGAAIIHQLSVGEWQKYTMDWSQFFSSLANLTDKRPKTLVIICSTSLQMSSNKYACWFPVITWWCSQNSTAKSLSPTVALKSTMWHFYSLTLCLLKQRVMVC